MDAERLLWDSGISGNELLAADTESEDETVEKAASFAKNLKAGDFVLLTGGLGSGKTVFVRGMAGIFGDGREVSSPSFKIINRYDGKPVLYHLDFYRLNEPEEAFGAGIEDVFSEPAVFAVEWPEIIIGYFKKFYLVEIAEIAEDARHIRIFDCAKE